MPTPRTSVGFGVFNNNIYVIGGYSSNPVTTNEVYAPEKSYYVFMKQ